MLYQTSSVHICPHAFMSTGWKQMSKNGKICADSVSWPLTPPPYPPPPGGVSPARPRLWAPGALPTSELGWGEMGTFSLPSWEQCAPALEMFMQGSFSRALPLKLPTGG